MTWTVVQNSCAKAKTAFPSMVTELLQDRLHRADKKQPNLPASCRLGVGMVICNHVLYKTSATLRFFVDDNLKALRSILPALKDQRRTRVCNRSQIRERFQILILALSSTPRTQHQAKMYPHVQMCDCKAAECRRVDPVSRVIQ